MDPTAALHALRHRPEPPPPLWGGVFVLALLALALLFT